MAVSKVRQNYHVDCEAGVNKQINRELYASYTYMSLAAYFDRDDIALPGFSKWFAKASEEEREHAGKFITYQNQRGGRVKFEVIQKPAFDDWNNGLSALEAALELEKSVNQALLELHGVAASKSDPQMCDFIETHFLTEQVEAIKELADMITQYKRCGTGLGEYMFDKETMGEEAS